MQLVNELMKTNYIGGWMELRFYKLQTQLFLPHKSSINQAPLLANKQSFEVMLQVTGWM